MQAKLQASEDLLAQKAAAEQAQSELTERVLKSSAALRDLDRDSLVRMLHQLRDALNTAEREKVELQTVLRSAKGSIDAFAVMKRDYKELQGAHMEQTKYLQKMQARINKADVYRNTIATQEGVISKMQSVLEARIKQNRSAAEKSGQLLPRPPRTPKHTERGDQAVVKDEGTVARAAYEALEAELREAGGQVEDLSARVSEVASLPFPHMAKSSCFDSGAGARGAAGAGPVRRVRQ